MKPQHVHLGVSVLLGIAALVALSQVEYAIGGFLALGAIAALIQWKAVKSGIVDL